MQTNHVENNDTKPSTPEGNATKECKYCKMQIPVQAKVCPFCRKRLRGKGIRVVLGGIAGVLVLFIVVIIAAAGSGSSKRAVDESTSGQRNQESLPASTQAVETRQVETDTQPPVPTANATQPEPSKSVVDELTSSQENQTSLPASTQTTEIQQGAIDTLPPTPTANAAQSEDVLTWPVAYLAEVLLSYQEHGDDVKYDLIYFDEDDIPELLICPFGCWTTMYTFSNGEIFCPMDNWTYGAGGNTGYSYLPGQNKLYNQFTAYAGAVRYFSFSRLNDAHEMEPTVTIEARAFDDKNGNGAPDDGEYFENYAYECYLDGRHLSEAEVSAYLDGIENYCFMDGTFSRGQIVSILNNSSLVNESFLCAARSKVAYRNYIENRFPSDDASLSDTTFYPFDANGDGIPELYCETHNDEAGSILCVFTGSSIETYRISVLNPVVVDSNTFDTIYYIPGTGRVWLMGWDNSGALVWDYFLITNSIQAVGISEAHVDENGEVYSAKYIWNYDDVDYNTYNENISSVIPSDGTSRSIKLNFKAYDRAGILDYFG